MTIEKEGKEERKGSLAPNYIRETAVGLRCDIALPVSEREFPAVDSLCSGDVDRRSESGSGFVNEPTVPLRLFILASMCLPLPFLL